MLNTIDGYRNNVDGETNSTGNLTGFSQGEMVIWKGEKRRHSPRVANRSHPQIVMDAMTHRADVGTVSSRETC